MTTAEERSHAIKEAGYNLFNLHAEDVLIDLLTDSGTGAMSRDQWAAIQHGDESYAGSPSWYRFEAAVKELFPYRHVIPTHQGRAAERILFSVVGWAGQVSTQQHSLRHTRANVEFSGAEARDLVISEGHDAANVSPFKGNMDLVALEALLQERADTIPVVFSTITNNSAAVSPFRWPIFVARARSVVVTASPSSWTPAALRRTPGSSTNAKRVSSNERSVTLCERSRHWPMA